MCGVNIKKFPYKEVKYQVTFDPDLSFKLK